MRVSFLFFSILSIPFELKAGGHHTDITKDPSVLNDITNGSNPNCGSVGFQASTGWDPVTGLGTPNYPRMLEYFLRLP